MHSTSKAAASLCHDTAVSDSSAANSPVSDQVKFYAVNPFAMEAHEQGQPHSANADQQHPLRAHNAAGISYASPPLLSTPGMPHLKMPFLPGSQSLRANVLRFAEQPLTPPTLRRSEQPSSARAHMLRRSEQPSSARAHMLRRSEQPSSARAHTQQPSAAGQLSSTSSGHGSFGRAADALQQRDSAVISPRALHSQNHAALGSFVEWHTSFQDGRSPLLRAAQSRDVQLQAQHSAESQDLPSKELLQGNVPQTDHSLQDPSASARRAVNTESGVLRRGQTAVKAALQHGAERMATDGLSGGDISQAVSAAADSGALLGADAETSGLRNAGPRHMFKSDAAPASVLLHRFAEDAEHAELDSSGAHTLAQDLFGQVQSRPCSLRRQCMMSRVASQYSQSTHLLFGACKCALC